MDEMLLRGRGKRGRKHGGYDEERSMIGRRCRDSEIMLREVNAWKNGECTVNDRRKRHFIRDVEA